MNYLQEPISYKSKFLIKCFIAGLVDTLENSIYVNFSDFNIFSDCTRSLSKEINWQTGWNSKLGKSSLVFVESPFGMRIGQTPFDDRSYYSVSQSAICMATDFLEDDGILICPTEIATLKNNPHGLRSKLLKKGCSIQAIINVPENFYFPRTSIRFPILIIKKGHVEYEFIGELEDNDQATELGIAFSSNVFGENLSSGFKSLVGEFDDFAIWKIQQQIKNILTEYKDFSIQKFIDVIDQIIPWKKGVSFENKENCLYIPKTGRVDVTSCFEELNPRHQYFQCVCKPELVDSNYLASFFKSELGDIILESLRVTSTMPIISISDLKDLEIPLPPLAAQIQVYSYINKLKQIRGKIASFESNLSLNPLSSEETLKQIDSMLDVVGSLAKSDKVKSLIREGESKSIEFKETLSVDTKTQDKAKYIELSAIKTVAAFLNSNGGTLLVGVNDAGEISGVDLEIAKFYKTNDSFLLKFKNLLKERIGVEAYNFIDYELIKIEGKHVLQVNCLKSIEPVYVDENDFYVRTNPATDKLEGPKMVRYIKDRFGNN